MESQFLIYYQSSSPPPLNAVAWTPLALLQLQLPLPLPLPLPRPLEPTTTSKCRVDQLHQEFLEIHLRIWSAHSQLWAAKPVPAPGTPATTHTSCCRAEQPCEAFAHLFNVSCGMECTRASSQCTNKHATPQVHMRNQHTRENTYER